MNWTHIPVGYGLLEQSPEPGWFMAEHEAVGGLNGVGSISEQVYVWLREQLLTGLIRPGELIDEKSMTSQFSISRTPVREAVKRLRDEHLVDIVAQSATRAAQLDPELIREAYIIRRALEMESAAQAATVISELHEEAIVLLIESHMRAIDREQYAHAIELDDEFHAYIASVSGLRRLWRTIEISKAQLDRCRHIMLPKFGEAQLTIQQHKDILEALKSRSADRARKAMKTHLDLAFNSTEQMLATSKLTFPLERKPGGRVRKSDDEPNRSDLN